MGGHSPDLATLVGISGDCARPTYRPMFRAKFRAPLFHRTYGLIKTVRAENNVRGKAAITPNLRAGAAQLLNDTDVAIIHAQGGEIAQFA